MRQRVMIAMAIALGPDLLIADEPTTALDVTVQAAILTLLHQLQERHGMALIFVSHDLGVVNDIADDVVVMRGGSVVEQGPYLKLNFKADAREADIRLLLVNIHGSLAAGPGQLGDYYVRVPAQQIDAITAQLKGDPIVEGLQVVDGLPARQ